MGLRKALVVPAFVPNACGPVEIAGPLPVARWVTVTPGLALKWLDEANINNRSVREDHVVRLAADMLAGRWRGQNGEPIRFDTNGRLVDGQHRLWASYQSGASFDTLLITGIDPEAYSTIGIGAKKFMGDFLGPVHGEKNVTLLAAALRLVHLWQNGKLGSPVSGSAQPSIAQMEITLRDHPNLRDSVNWIASSKTRLLTSSYACLIHYAGTLENKSSRVESFLERLNSGLGLMEDDPVYQLRKFLLSQRTATPGHRRAGRTYVLALAIKAWNASKLETRCRQLHFRADEQFPQL